MSEFSAKDIDLALQYAQYSLFEASLGKEGEVIFQRSPLPIGLSEALTEEINFVADYFQRMVFEGDLDPEDPDPRVPDFDDPLAEINFKLDFYKSEFTIELKKSLGVTNHRQINPYAHALLQHSAEVKANQKKR
ncbi:MAG: hypothetical protein A2527_09550 [Candidatus Lambdaproteobacteria bacterium RIFOXYD2_FULL_50_16]|uniref:Uncharacterized protein n=1 Tax=Candidatus Lambdaproteobacteria bacterium RIFOXYD2_FULL_50_16 TaxID=1817772 RepID=A0A1F6G7I9_9PROT|nr:MAG: hypothetical protein A2527_09550 [Candidatus Lambdaproteobacteria bacterium RIFOXYD2_FULL_50_16]